MACPNNFACKNGACLNSCNGNADCLSNRFCDAGTCKDACSPLNSSNVVPNAGFDSDIGHWFTSDPMVQWSADDAEGCTTSGSLQFTSAVVSLTDCLQVSAGSHVSWGMDTKGPVHCYINYYSDAACQTFLDSAAFDVDTPGWTRQDLGVNLPVGGRSIHLECDNASLSPARIDRVYVNSGFNSGY
jgi:hypothetical protein